jgi:hypothetical protein
MKIKPVLVDSSMAYRDVIVAWERGIIDHQWIEVIPGRIIPGSDQVIDIYLVHNATTLHAALHDEPVDNIRGLILVGNNPPAFVNPGVRVVTVEADGDFDTAIRSIMLERVTG